MSTELDEVTMAVAAINKVESGLAALRETYGGVIFEVTTSAGMEVARAARRAIREPRFEVERIRKAAKAPILALGKKLDAEAARITRELTLIEAPIDEVITAEEARKEREKEQRIAAELARTEEIQRRLDWMRDRPVKAAGKSSAEVLQMIDTLDGYLVDETVFEERLDDAKAVLDVSRAALRGLHVAALDSEAKAEQLKRDQEELAKLRAAEEERQRVAAEERAKQEAADKAKRDDDAARQAVANRLERERIAKEEADAKAIRDAESKRLAAERAENERVARERQADLDRQAEEQRIANAAEARRIADQQAEVARQQEALRISQLPKPAAKRAKHNPGSEALIDVIAQHYSVDAGVARRWLVEIDWDVVPA